MPGTRRRRRRSSAHTELDPLFFSSVMYRKYKEQKDKEYESIIKKQVNESKLVAEHEGIAIPKTLDDYVAPSRAGAFGTTAGKNGKKSECSHEDDVDLGIDVSVSRRASGVHRVFFVF